MAYITFQPHDYFNTLLYTGTGSTNALTGVGFAPDMIWGKNRGQTYNHQINDTVRGANKQLAPNNTNAQETNSGELTAFGSDGFTVGSGGTLNGNGDGIVSWNWKAGTTSGIATNGSTVITPSAYSFNQTSGFSIVQYTGNGNTTTKVAHGLGAAPKWIIIKKTSAGGDNWKVYHVGIGNTTALQLDNNGATSGGSDNFYDTTPDTVNFTLGNHTSVNANGATYIAYCFAEKTGFSKFGKYSGNVNLDGPFIYTGFKPAWVMIKSSTLANQSWTIFNNGLDSFNEMTNTLQADTNGAEDGNTGYNDADFVSNGFKIREDNDNINATGQDYVYMAFAEAPIVGTNNIPATAR